VSTPELLLRQINGLVGDLVEMGLAQDQNYVFLRKLSATSVEVTFPRADHLSIALKDQAYSEVYDILLAERALVIKLPDGALIQMQYLFEDDALERHRLAFFPSPHLEEFQNNPEVYLEDAAYADIVARSIVPFPIRFDFDCRDGVWKELEHPKSHLSLGQYENCRIPVSAPLSPACFMDFVLRNFYNTAFIQYADRLPKPAWWFNDSILATEQDVVHIKVPTGTPRRKRLWLPWGRSKGTRQ